MIVAVNRKIRNKPAKPNAYGWENAEMTVDELIEHIRLGYAWSPGVIRSDYGSKKKPSSKDIEKAYLIAIDIDNNVHLPDGSKRKKTEEEGYFDFDVVKTNSWFVENLLFAYTTPSHTDDHHRFRLVFQLESPVDANEYKKIATALNTHFNGDVACSNIDRMFYGYNKTEVVQYNKTLQNKELQRIMVDIELHNQYLKHNKFNEKNLTPDDIREILHYIPQRTDYYTWLRVFSAVANYFKDDPQTAFRILEDWSPDYEKGTMYRIKHCLQKYTIGTAIYYAKQYGYSFKKNYNESNSSIHTHQLQSDEQQPKRNSAQKKFEQVMQIHNYLKENYDIRYNSIKNYAEIKRKTETEYRQVTDNDVNSLYIEMLKAGIDLSVQTLNTVLDSNMFPKVNPIYEYFNNLPQWDGNDYLEQLLESVRVIDEHRDIWGATFTRWIIALVASCLGKKDKNGHRIVNHICPIFVGKQGIGKTRFINSLVPPELTQYYCTATINPLDKDSKIMLVENFLLNLDEFEDMTSNERSALKSNMTITTVTVRRPYARRAESMQRIVSFIGSVNKAMFLSDYTGNRRFIPIETLEFTPIQINHKQLYAQAKHLFETGFKYYFDKEEIDYISEMSEDYTINFEEELFLANFKIPTLKEIETQKASIKKLTCTAISEILNAKTKERVNKKRLGQIMKKLNVIQRHERTRNSTVRLYYVIPIDKNIYVSDYINDNDDNDNGPNF